MYKNLLFAWKNNDFTPKKKKRNYLIKIFQIKAPSIPLLIHFTKICFKMYENLLCAWNNNDFSH